MVTVEVSVTGWVAECLECERRVVIDAATLASGDLFESHTVLRSGDDRVPHAWSSDLSNRLGLKAN